MFASTKKIIMTKLSDLIKHLEDMGAVYDRYGVRYTLVGEPYGMLDFLKAYGVDTHFYIDYEVERAIIKEGYIITFLDIEGQFINTKIKKHEKINN